MPQLENEEYIEQAYLWRTLHERLGDGIASQDILQQIQEEVLSTTRLPMAIDFLLGEMRHRGRMSDAMRMMDHYFTPFQAYIMDRAEDESVRFDTLIAIRILEAEAEYRAAPQATPQGLFMFQFECVARNRLGYDGGLTAIANDPLFDASWQQWIRWIRQQLGAAEFAQFLYLRSQFLVEERRRALRDTDWTPDHDILFGVREGRIAKANLGKEPLYMFQALQRQLGYPGVPKPEKKTEDDLIHPVLKQRFEQLEKRLKLIEQEQKGGIDLSEFYLKPDESLPGPGEIPDV